MIKKMPIFILLIISASAAIICSYLNYFRIFLWLKPLTTILIIISAFQIGKPEKSLYTKAIISGLVFCLLGDVLLLNDQFFIYGLISFLIAHLIFTYSFIKIGGFSSNYIHAVVLLIIGILYYAFLYKSLGQLAIPVLLYLLVILLMCWQGLSFECKSSEVHGRFVHVAVILFVISDATLAYNKFIVSSDSSPLLILGTYWTSLFMLALSTQCNISNRRLV